MLAMADLPIMALKHTALDCKIPEGKDVAASFSKAATSYSGAARLQRQVAYTALDALIASRQSLGKQDLGHLLDLGCGPGWLQPELCQKAKRVTAVDLSAGMLAQAASQGLAIDYLLADAAALPLTDNSVDTVFSSLMLQWCPAPERVFAEVVRVLKPGGCAVLTTLVAGTLAELAQAFASVDHHAHIHPFLNTAQLNAATTGTARGILDWQQDSACYQLPYADIFTLARELKALGASHLAHRAQQGLTGKGYWQRVAAAYPQQAMPNALLASYHVVQLLAVKPAEASPKTISQPQRVLR